jgi:PIN domain nuclease of toxin-antitoxin system
MRLLLDTPILLWWLADDPALPVRANVLIADPANETFVSPISLWEIAIKAHLGKIVADLDEIRTASLASGFTPLPFTDAHAVAITHLPDHHHDPFDRALIAQAHVEPLHLITHNQMVGTYSGQILLV